MVKFFLLLLFATLLSAQLYAQDAVLRVYTDKKKQAHVVSTNGKDTVIPPQNGQVGIDSVRTAEDGQTVGWLVLYANPESGAPFAGMLVVWQSDEVIRRFKADQTFWSWAFYDHGSQVAYHVGPTHGEKKSHCELHDLKARRLMASWDGDLDNPDRPLWTKGLDH